MIGQTNIILKFWLENLIIMIILIGNISNTHGNSKTCVKWPLSKRSKIGFQDQLSLNADQNYCRMLQGEHSAILLTFINLPLELVVRVCKGEN